jgi:hypothetical protein
MITESTLVHKALGMQIAGSIWASHDTLRTADAQIAVYEDHTVFDIACLRGTGGNARRVFAVLAPVGVKFRLEIGIATLDDLHDPIPIIAVS